LRQGCACRTYNLGAPSWQGIHNTTTCHGGPSCFAIVLWSRRSGR
jgi:hypothetical protein